MSSYLQSRNRVTDVENKQKTPRQEERWDELGDWD